MNRQKGFTLLELIVVIAIIGILVAIFIVSLDESRKRSRDGNRAAQVQEFLKAAELFYTDNSRYPDDGIVDSNVQLNTVNEFLILHQGYLSRIPEDPRFPDADGYYFCSEEKSMTIFVHAESGGGEYCYISRGPSAMSSYCGASIQTTPAIPLASVGNCNTRF